MGGRSNEGTGGAAKAGKRFYFFFKRWEDIFVT
jgi:hypothetical protein